MESELWQGKPTCPHCRSVEVYQMKDRATGQRSKRFLWRCKAKGCKKQFTVRVGTVMEDSKIAIRHWCYAFWAACAGKKGVSALQIKRQTGISYESALFLMHRVRFAMATNYTLPAQLEGTIEADETYVGGKPRFHNRANMGTWKATKATVFAMVERDGEARAFPVERVDSFTLQKTLIKHVSHDAQVFTDQSKLYPAVGDHFLGGHESVNHSKYEYVRTRPDGTKVHTNTVEGFFSIFKRALHGTWHSVSRHHLHRYVSECAFRYSTRELEDGGRVALAITKARGKRLFYRNLVLKKSA